MARSAAPGISAGRLRCCASGVSDVHRFQATRTTVRLVGAGAAASSGWMLVPEQWVHADSHPSNGWLDP
eukprot:5927003-Alexandrium_andersonii.AAC.1